MENLKIKISILTILFITTINAQYFELVKDINTSQFNDSQIQGLVILNDQMFFTAYDGAGTEFWTSDGTETGTTKLTGLIPSNTGTPIVQILFNDEVYFHFNDGVHGIELWKTDGTVSGTQLLKDINPNGNGIPSLKSFAIINNKLVFRANDGTNGTELWATDGTEIGTTMLNNLVGTDNSEPYHFTKLNGKLYYYTKNLPNYDYYVWVTDGTVGGTTQVPNIPYCYGDCSLGKLNGELYFEGDDISIGTEPWVTDGTLAGSRLLKDIDMNNPSGSGPRFLLEANSLLFFLADDGTSTTWSNPQLWATDGTEQGTQLVKNMGGGIAGHFSFNDIFYFYNSQNLWKSDGTPAGTVEAQDVNGQSISNPFSDDYEYIIYKDDLYFASSLGLTKIDHTTNQITHFEPQNQTYNEVLGGYKTPMIVYNDALYFSAKYNDKGFELWKFSDTPPVNTNLNEIDLKFPFKISPIPATNSISISATNLNLKQVFIINSLGQKLLIGNKNIQNNTIDISQLSQGIYFLNIETEDGKLGIEKFVKN